MRGLVGIGSVQSALGIEPYAESWLIQRRDLHTAVDRHRFVE